MRHLADPATLSLGVVSWLFLAGMLVLLPAAVVMQERQLRGRPSDAFPTRPVIYFSAFVTHLVILIAALLAARDAGLTLLPAYDLSVTHALVAAGALGLGSLTLLERLTPRDDARRRAESIAPRTGRDAAAFAGVATSAGIAEEVAYRGVLFSLLAHLIGGWWLPAVVAAVAFGVAHAFQGWRAAALATAAGIVAQVVVGLTGTLLVAIGVHILHDLIAGAVIGRRARRHAPGDNAVPV